MQRHLRLRRREDFVRLRAHGQVQRHPLLIMSVAPNSLPHNRYGFITSKQLGNAVKRNRVRRLLREAVRHAHPVLKPGHDIVIIPRRRIMGQPYTAVQQAVTRCLQQAGLWEHTA
jgi:ribonuclease P protein component